MCDYSYIQGMQEKSPPPENLLIFQKLLQAIMQNFVHKLPYYIYTTVLSFVGATEIIQLKHDNTCQWHIVFVMNLLNIFVNRQF